MVHPETLWAQRSSEDDPSKNILYVTLNVPELNDDYSLTIQGNKLEFKGATHPPSAGGTASTVEQKTFELSLELFGEVEEVRRTLNGKSLALVLRKKELGTDYWPRLTKDKVKLQYLKTDFSKWKDEDEQDDVEEEAEEPQGPPGGGMGGMPGMGGAGGPPGGGMDFASMMQGMGGGAGGAGGSMDFEALMKQMQASGGLGGGEGGEGGDFGAGGEFGDAPEEEDEDDEGPPPLEEA